MENRLTHYQIEDLLKNYNINEFVQHLTEKGILLEQEVKIIKAISSKQCIVDFLSLVTEMDSERLNSFLDTLILFVSESMTHTLTEISKLKMKLSSTNKATECSRTIDPISAKALQESGHQSRSASLIERAGERVVVNECPEVSKKQPESEKQHQCSSYASVVNITNFFMTPHTEKSLHLQSQVHLSHLLLSYHRYKQMF